MADITQLKVGSTTYNIVDAGATRTTVMPNDSGEIKTKYRIAKKDYTGGAGTYWYYEICKLPKNDSGNYASAIISGRIGGWESGNMSYINALIWNRGTPGLAITGIGGTATAARTIWDICDLVLYTNSDGTATLYAKCANWFTFDLDLELFQSTANITYSGNKLTSVPGTLNSAASATPSRTELINGELYVAGTQMSKSNHNHDDKYITAAQTEALIVSNGGATLSNNTTKTIGTIAGTALTCQLGSAITISGRMTAGSFYASSDLKLKENIKDYIPKNSILDLPIVEFDFKDSKSHQIGCIAQDLQNLFPELVNTNENGYLTIAENKLVYLCILEIKKLKAELEALKISKE